MACDKWQVSGVRASGERGRPARRRAGVREWRAKARRVLGYSSPMRGCLRNGFPRTARWRSALPVACAALALLAGAGCQSGAAVMVASSVPRPLVAPLKAHVGVYYEDALTNYVHREEVDGGDYAIDIGASQAPVFTQVFDALFERVVPMGREPVASGADDSSADTASADADEDAAEEEDAPPPIPFRRMDGGDGPLDGVLAPAIDQVQFSTPQQTRSDFYEVWIRYRMRLFNADGTMRKEWPLIGYGKANNRNGGDAGECLNEATIWALRDAAAVLAFELRDNLELNASGGDPIGGEGI